jgi:hypothetical protein
MADETTPPVEPAESVDTPPPVDPNEGKSPREIELEAQLSLETSKKEKLLDEKKKEQAKRKEATDATISALEEQEKYKELSVAQKNELSEARTQREEDVVKYASLETQNAEYKTAFESHVKTEIDSLPKNHQDILKSKPGFSELSDVKKLQEIKFYKQYNVNGNTSPGGGSPNPNDSDAAYEQAKKNRDPRAMIRAQRRA